MDDDFDDAPGHERISPLSDEEADLFRFIRYGQLPPPIDPSQMVAEVDTRQVQPDDRPATESRRWQHG
jgi:hypothetical protein